MTAETLASARATLHMPLAPAYLQWLMEHLQQEGVQVTAGNAPGSYRLMMDSVGTLELNLRQQGYAKPNERVFVDISGK